MSAFKQHQIRVFISSAMEKERQILTKQVFPEIRRRCQARGIDFLEIDSRHKSLSMSFQQIDLCRPYFIALLGQHYGPTIQHELDYPWIENAYLSLTELEILYALFGSQDKLQASAKKALFYFRDLSQTVSETFYIKQENALSCFSNPHVLDTLPDQTSSQKQQDLKQRLRAYSCHITEYKQATDLKDIVLEQLWTQIEQDIPIEPEQEDFEHDAFATNLQSFYVKQQAHFDRLTAHALSDDPPLVIAGESGSGKSALLANWVLEYRQAHPDEFIFWHFCSPSTDPIALLRQIMSTFKSHFQIPDELPNTPETVTEQFPQWLAQGRVILIIDGLNQSELPDFFPANIRLFLSSQEQGLNSWHLPLLTDKARETFITSYLQQTLPPFQMQRLLDAPQTKNPLYLKTILEEWRHVQKLDHYLQAQTPSALYQKVLERLEAGSETRKEIIGKALSLLWAARRGLQESEILAMLDIPEAIWASLLQTALVNRAGLLNFCHETLRQAVQTRYLPNEQTVHRQLADYFEQQPLSSRIADELPYQLMQAKESVRLHDCISQIPMFLQLMKDDKAYELWRYWHWLGTDLMVEAYQKALTISQEDKLLEALDSIAIFFKSTGFYTAALPLFQQALKIRQKDLGTNHPDLVQSINHLAFLLKKKGDYEKAKQFYHLALQISKQALGAEHPDTVQSLNHLALSLQKQGEYEKAERLYRQALEIRKKALGMEHPDTATSLNNLALLFQSKGNYKAAETLYRQTIKIRQKILGSEHPLTASSLNSLALLLANKGDYERAGPLYRQVLKISEKVLGAEHPNTATSLNSLALSLKKKGDNEGAISLYRRALVVFENVLGEKH
ncbi:MAG: tetratricopeptide repeat protein [Pseudomonadota bacterium]